MPEYYSSVATDSFSLKITDNVYLRNSFQDSIYAKIKNVKLLPKRYRYSDLPYYLLKRYIEQTYNNQGLDVLLQDFMLSRMGCSRMTFNPLERYDISELVPTEVDNYYRQEELRGNVHDPGAIMQNGVGGHAGLFANSLDVAKVMQMYLQKGFYGGEKISTEYYGGQIQ